MTDDQIKVLQEILDELTVNCDGCEVCLFEGDQSCISKWEQNRFNALTAAIDYIRDTSEMLEAVSHLEWDAEDVGMSDSTVFGIYREADGWNNKAEEKEND